MMTCIFKLQADHTWKRLKILLSFSTLFACVSVAAKLAGVFHPDVMIIPPTHFQFQYFVQTALKNVWFLETGMEMCIHVFLDLILYFSSTVYWCIGSFWSFEWIQRRNIFSRPSHATECTEFVCECVHDSWLTLMAIWFHDAARRSDAFYDRSQYIPQAWAEREEEDKRQTQYLKLMKQEHHI